MLFFRALPILLLLGLIGLVHAAVSEFILRDLDGVEHRLQDYRGKWIVVNYWATWCPPCVKEIPELNAFHNRHKNQGAVVVGVNMEDIADDQVRDFLNDFQVDYPILLAEADFRSPLGPIDGLPTTFLVSPEGKVVERILGQVSKKRLETLISRHSAEVLGTEALHRASVRR